MYGTLLSPAKRKLSATVLIEGLFCLQKLKTECYAQEKRIIFGEISEIFLAPHIYIVSLSSC